MLPHIISEDSITILIDNYPEVVSSAHPNFDLIAEAIQNGDWDEIPDLVKVADTIVKASRGGFTIRNDEVYYNDTLVTGRIGEVMISYIRNGLDLQPLLNFYEKLQQNPRYSVVNELYDFIEQADTVVFHPDGDFIAYKLVRDDYRDIYSGRVDNSPGQKLPRLESNQVDDDRYRTCSKGYHFCSAGYLPHYGSANSRVVLVKINPADVVAIPTDYNYAKGRATTYEILAEVPRDRAVQILGGMKNLYSL